MNKDMINQRDEQGLRHGYWEGRILDGTLNYKGVYIHGNIIGPWTMYSSNEKIFKTGFFNKMGQIGLWYEKKYDKSTR